MSHFVASVPVLFQWFAIRLYNSVRHGCNNTDAFESWPLEYDPRIALTKAQLAIPFSIVLKQAETSHEADESN
jgi:hypothetical protein